MAEDDIRKKAILAATTSRHRQRPRPSSPSENSDNPLTGNLFLETHGKRASSDMIVILGQFLSSIHEVSFRSLFVPPRSFSSRLHSRAGHLRDRPSRANRDWPAKLHCPADGRSLSD